MRRREASTDRTLPVRVSTLEASQGPRDEAHAELEQPPHARPQNAGARKKASVTAPMFNRRTGIYRSCGIVLSAIFGTTSAVHAAAREITGVKNFQIVSRLTGSPSQNQTTAVGIGGTDLGHMVNHNGKTYFLFGDTFAGETPFSGGGDWR